MPDTEAAPSTQATSEAPVSEPSSTPADVTAWAKAQAEKLEAAETPQTETPDSPKQEPAKAENEAQEPEGETEGERKLSRRERDEQRREEIRREERTRLEAEFKASQEQERLTRERQEAEQSLLSLIEKADAGDYNAAKQLTQIIKGQVIDAPKQTAREATVYQAGRNAVLSEMAKDFEPSVRAVEGVTDADFASLRDAQTSGQFAQRAIDVGRRLGTAAWESEKATLEATITQLKGQLAARGPSPVQANGYVSSGTNGARPSDMRSIAAQVAQELGVPF